MLSAYDYWQYWRNCEDADVGRFMKLFTTLSLAEISRLAALGGTEINEAKKVLATQATAMVHGQEAADNAAETARRTFEEGTLAATLPSINIPADRFREGVGILTLIVEAGLASSNSEARRNIKGGAIRVNDQPINNERALINESAIDDKGMIKLSMGKKRHVVVMT